MRAVRLVWLGFVLNLKMLSRSAFTGILGVIWPLFFATTAFFMFRTRHDPSALLYALYEALTIVDEEGLEARWARHERNHKAFVAGLASIGLSLLPPEADRLHSLNTVKIPEGVDDAAVRKMLLEEYGIEIGGGLGPLAGKIWRVGLMGNSSSSRLVVLLLGALQSALAKQKVNA